MHNQDKEKREDNIMEPVMCIAHSPPVCWPDIQTVSQVLPKPPLHAEVHVWLGKSTGCLVQETTNQHWLQGYSEIDL